MNIAVFSSHNGTDFQAIIDACKSGRLDAKVSLFITNNKKAIALERARDAGIYAMYLNYTALSNERITNEILDSLRMCNVDFIFLAGFLKKVDDRILEKYKTYNIHPSLLPKYGGKGMYGINVHKAVIEAKEKETGITIHEVNSKYDDGKIVAQTKVDVLPGDTPEILAERVLEREHTFIVETLDHIIKTLAK